MRLVKIVPTPGRVAVDCKNCGSKHFEVHVSVILPDARIEELVCTKCATYYKTEFGLIAGKPDARRERGITVPVQTRTH